MPQSTFKTIDSIDVSGKRVLVRVDLNVPMENGRVTDVGTHSELLDRNTHYRFVISSLDEEHEARQKHTQTGALDIIPSDGSFRSDPIGAKEVGE